MLKTSPWSFKMFHEKFQQHLHLQVSIPNSIQLIGGWAFYGCSSLLHVTLPVSLTRILARAFAGCSALMSIHIPNSVSFIGAGDPDALEWWVFLMLFIHLFFYLILILKVEPPSSFSFWRRKLEHLRSFGFFLDLVGVRTYYYWNQTHIYILKGKFGVSTVSSTFWTISLASPKTLTTNCLV